MHPLLAAALQRASQTGQSVPVTIGNVTLTAYPNGQVGPQGAGGTARWTPQTTSMPVPPRPPFGTYPSSPVPSQTEQSAGTGLPLTGTPATSSVSQQPAAPSMTGATYTDPTTLQSFSYVPTTGAVVASGPGYGDGTVIPQTSQSGPLGSTGPVDRHDDPVAAQARVYRINHGLATPDDSAATDALNAESLAAARAGRTSFNRDLAAQYGQTPAAGTYGPRTDVVNALSLPTTTGQAIMLAPTTAVTQQRPAVLSTTGNNLLAQGLY